LNLQVRVIALHQIVRRFHELLSRLLRLKGQEQVSWGVRLHSSFAICQSFDFTFQIIPAVYLGLHKYFKFVHLVVKLVLGLQFMYDILHIIRITLFLGLSTVP